MGTDIHGWVEVCWQDDDETQWYGAICATNLLWQNYYLFGGLFGVRNSAGFVPVVGLRGLPEDVSHEAQKEITELGAYAHSPTWITWQEIAAINWDEEIVDGRPHFIETLKEGRQFHGASYPQEGWPTEEGATWTEGNREYRIERIKRGDAIDADWRLVFKLMETLSEAKGADAVRLVVWFDN